MESLYRILMEGSVNLSRLESERLYLAITPSEVYLSTEQVTRIINYRITFGIEQVICIRSAQSAQVRA
jgi:hypothetical protein